MPVIFARLCLCMFFDKPPMNDSSASTSPFIFSIEPTFIASRMRWSRNQADFCVIPRSRAISYELMPFLQFATIQIAANHLSKPSGLSSMIVPTLALNWRFGCFSLHSQRRRVGMNLTSVRPQAGQCTPFGQRSSTIVRSATSGLAKYRMASRRVQGSVLMP